MNVLYVGRMKKGTTTLDRMRALQRLGYRVTPLDISRFESSRRVLRSIQWRYNHGWLLRDLNQCILKSIQKNKFDILWIDKGVWVFPETIESAKKTTGARVVHFTPDPQLMFHRSKHFIRSIPIYDHLITTKQFEIPLYEKAGAKHVVLSQQSYCVFRYEKAAPREEFRSDIGFVGHYESHYARQASSLYKNLNVGVWGPGWERAVFFGRVSRSFVRGGGLTGDDYVNALASFKIGLGLLSKFIPEQHTTRTFEIPAAGALLLAERTEEHQVLFKEGLEADFFSSPEELTSKAKFYLKNDECRKKVAENGRMRCIRGGYDTDSVLKRALNEIIEAGL